MQKAFKYLIISLLSIISTNTKAQVVDGIIGVVGQKVILQSDIKTQALQEASRKEGGEARNDCAIFEDLLFQMLLVNQAKVDSIEVTEDQVERELSRRLDLFEDQTGGREAMEKYFNKPYLEIKNSFRDIVEDQLLAQQMQGKITAEIDVTPKEVKNFYRSLPKDSLPLVESEIELGQIVIAPEISKGQIEKIKRTLNDYKKRVAGGEDFGFLASMYSDDVASAQNEGSLGWVRRGSLVPEFAAAAFSMTKKGEISDIIKTDYGYHIIQFQERKGTRILIRHILKIPKPQISAKREAKDRLDSIAKAIRNNEISFEEAAGKYSTDKETNKNGGMVVNPYTGTATFKSSQLSPIMNYTLKSLNINEISEPFEGTGVSGKFEIKILKLLNKTEPHVGDINKDYQLISEMAKEQKNQEIVNDWIKKTQKNTYIKIDENYLHCDFKYKGWQVN